MTIGAWVAVVAVALCGLAIAGSLFFVAKVFNSVGYSIAAAATLLIAAAICCIFIWYRSNSERGKRALRDQESDLTGGIERTVLVYDINGNLIKEYSGRFDIETDHKSYILFDDENGNRHMIYYSTGTIIIDER